MSKLYNTKYELRSLVVNNCAWEPKASDLIPAVNNVQR